MVDIWESGTFYEAVVGDFRTARYAEATLLLIGTMFAGGGQTNYEEVCNAVGLQGFSEKCNRSYFWRFYNAAEALMKESQAKCHEYLKSQAVGGFDAIVGLFDGGWLHRGYASQHGSAAIVDVTVGCILWLGHRSKDPSKFGRRKHLMSSGMMEVCILHDLLEEAKKDGATISTLVADADTGIRNAVAAHKISLARCCNHGGKNAGNKGIEIGKAHPTCDCAVRLTQKGQPYKTGDRLHLKITIPIAKKVQAAFGAQTVTCGSDSAKWLKQIPQIINHYYDDHLVVTLTEETDSVEGNASSDWLLLDVVSQCDSHGLFLKDEFTELWVNTKFKITDKGTITDTRLSQNELEVIKHCPFMPRTFAHRFDCPQMKEDWDEYMKTNLLCDAEMFCTPAGAVRTNLVETVWKSFLKFRNKDSNIQGDRYVMVTNIAGAFFNQPYIMQWDSEYCVQARLAELIGVPVPAFTRAKWDRANMKRMDTSIRRHTEKHKKLVAVQKKGRRLRREQDAKDATKRKESYRSGQHFGESTVASERVGGSGQAKGRVCACGAALPKRARKCDGCKAPKGKKKTYKGKGKGKARAKASDRESSESESESEPEVYDLTQDAQLNQNLDDRIAKVKKSDKLEYMCETDQGDSWFDGVVHHINGDDTVKFVEDDDGCVHHNFCLRSNIWKFL